MVQNCQSQLSPNASQVGPNDASQERLERLPVKRSKSGPDESERIAGSGRIAAPGTAAPSVLAIPAESAAVRFSSQAL